MSRSALEHQLDEEARRLDHALRVLPAKRIIDILNGVLITRSDFTERQLRALGSTVSVLHQEAWRIERDDEDEKSA